MIRNVKDRLALYDDGTAALAFHDVLINGVPMDDPRCGFKETHAKKSGAARAAEREARERQRRDALYAEKGQQYD